MGRLKSLCSTPLFWLFALVTVYRLYMVFQPPLRSTDLLRHMGFGKEFWNYGLAIYEYAPQDFGDVPYANLWPQEKYNYPAVAILFFALLSKVWPSLFFGKLALTLLEMANTFLVWKITKDRLLPLIYYANPVSLWWVSREGQFEPLALLFAFLALYLLPRRPSWGYFSLALGVQAKIFPIFLLPYFLRKRVGWGEALSFVAGFLPSLIFAWRGPYLSRLLGRATLAPCNPYAWNVFDLPRLCYSPPMLILTNALVTYAILILGLVLMFRRRAFFEYVGLLAFVVALKSMTTASPWYLLALPLMAVPINQGWERRLFFLLGSLDRVAIRRLLGIPSEFAYLRPKLMDAMWGF